MSCHLFAYVPHAGHVVSRLVNARQAATGSWMGQRTLPVGLSARSSCPGMTRRSENSALRSSSRCPPANSWCRQSLDINGHDIAGISHDHDVYSLLVSEANARIEPKTVEQGEDIELRCQIGVVCCHRFFSELWSMPTGIWCPDRLQIDAGLSRSLTRVSTYTSPKGQRAIRTGIAPI